MTASLVCGCSTNSQIKTTDSYCASLIPLRGYGYLNIEPGILFIEMVKANPHMLDDPAVIKRLHVNKKLFQKNHSNMKRYVQRGCSEL